LGRELGTSLAAILNFTNFSNFVFVYFPLQKLEKT
jgi:hypothetical protein